MEMDEVRERLVEKMHANNIKSATIIRYINRKCGYRVDPGEFSKTINGLLMSPKANRIIADAWTYVKQEENREKALS